MGDLPAKQSVFLKIRNNILNFGLSNSLTRSIMVNTLPAIFGYNLTRYVLNNDGQDLEGTMKFISSMGKSAIRSNFSAILYNAKNKAVRDNNLFEDDVLNILTNKILDSVRSGLEGVATEKLLKDSSFLSFELSDDTRQRLVDAIDAPNRTSSEISKILDLRGIKMNYSSGAKIAIALFESFTLEQRKEHFSKLLLIPQSYSMYNDKGYSYIFGLFPEEDRLEQYEKILELFKDDESGYTDTYTLSKCFGMLSAEDRIKKLPETYEQMIASDERAESNRFRSKHLSTNHLISVLAVVPVEEQEKYYKEILQNCDEDVNQIISYTRSLDKSLQGEIFIEAITKAREITEKDEFYRTNNNFRYVELMKSFEPELMVDNFINILNGDINNPNFKLIFDLLSEKEIKQIIEPYLQSKQIITEEQLKLLKENGYNVDDLSILFTISKCNQIVQKYEKNPDRILALSAIDEIAGLAKDIKFKRTGYSYDDKNYNQFIEKKLESYMKIYSSLDEKDKEEVFVHITELALKLSLGEGNFEEQIKNTITEMYNLLEDKSKVSQFPEFVEAIFKAYGSYAVAPNFIDLIIKQNDPELNKSIYMQYIDLFNKGISTQVLSKEGKVLRSERFRDGLIKTISEDDNISFLDETKMDELLENNVLNYNDNVSKEIVNIFIQTRLGKIKNNYKNLPEEEKEQNISKVFAELAKPININMRSFSKDVAQLEMAEMCHFFDSLDPEKKEKHYETLYAALDTIEDREIRKNGYMRIFRNLDDKEQLKRFPEIFEHIKEDGSAAVDMYRLLVEENKAEIFENFLIQTPENLKVAAEILNISSIQELNNVFKGKLVLDDEKIAQLMSIKPEITMKTLLFDKNVDREKILDLSSYTQLQARINKYKFNS